MRHAPPTRGFASVALARRESDQVVPQEIMAELSQLEDALHKASHMDGTKRRTFSLETFPHQLPKHEIEEGLFTLDCHVRPSCGQTFNKWLRKIGRMPARLHSLPGEESAMLHMDKREADKLVTLYGRHGCTARLVRLRVVHPKNPKQVLAEIRAKPQEVRVNARTLQVENLDFMFCPQDRIVKVDVPVRLLNEDVAPGTKKGGWMSMLKRTVRYKAVGANVPPFIEVDVRSLDLEQEVRVRDLPIPPRTKLAWQDYDDVVVRCTTDVGKD